MEFDPNDDYKTALEQLSTFEAKLTRKEIGEIQIDDFNKYVELSRTFNSTCEKNAFESGIKLGVQLMAEIFEV